MQFLKDKFEFLIVTVVLIILIHMWYISDYRPDIKEFVIIVSGAWLALLRVVQKPSANIQTDYVRADNIEAANTETGDIIGIPTPKK